MKPIDARPLEWIDDAPVQVSVARDMAATPEEVWTIIADHEAWPDWFPSVDAVEVVGRPEGIGGERLVTVKGMGRVEEEFNAWEPGRRFGFTVVAMSRPSLNSLNELVTIEPSRVGSLVTYQQGFHPKRWIAPVIKRAARSRIPDVLLGALGNLERKAIAQRT